MTKCNLCNDTGSIDTGNNDLPCSCEAGDKALFNIGEVDGTVTGAEVKRHFLNNSPEPLKMNGGKILATQLPGRNSKAC